MTIRLLQRLLTKGDTFIDIGANVGLHTLAARQSVGASGRVISFDPNLPSLNFLLHNVALNGFSNVESIGAALSNRTGLTRLTNVSISSLGTAAEATDSSHVGQLVPVFDAVSILAELKVGPIKLAKIDVEGTEGRILESLLRREFFPENFIFEFIPHLAKEVMDPASLLSMLFAKGYEILTIDGTACELSRSTCPRVTSGRNSVGQDAH